METIGKQIRNQRKELKLSQNDLREKLGLKSVNTIQAWESDRVVPLVCTLVQMHELFGWEFDVKFATRKHEI